MDTGKFPCGAQFQGMKKHDDDMRNTKKDLFTYNGALNIIEIQTFHGELGDSSYNKVWHKIKETEVRAYLFDRDLWSTKEAGFWLEDNGIEFNKVIKLKNYILARVRYPDYDNKYRLLFDYNNPGIIRIVDGDRHQLMDLYGKSLVSDQVRPPRPTMFIFFNWCDWKYNDACIWIRKNGLCNDPWMANIEKYRRFEYIFSGDPLLYRTIIENTKDSIEWSHNIDIEWKTNIPGGVFWGNEKKNVEFSDLKLDLNVHLPGVIALPTEPALIAGDVEQVPVLVEHCNIE